jgi:hypothetical protein
MLLAEERSKTLDTLGIRDIKLVILDLCQTAIRTQRLCFLQLWIVLDIFESLFSSCLVTRRKIDQKWACIGGRFWILDSKLSDCMKKYVY